MSLTVSNDRAKQLRATLVAAGANLSIQAVKRLLASYQVPTVRQPVIQVQGGRRSTNNPRARGGKPKSKRPGMGSAVPKSIGSGLGNSVTTHLRGLISLANTSAYTGAFAWTLGCNPSSQTTISAIGASIFGNNMVAFSGMYREFRISKLAVRFMPSANNTAGGQISMGVDPEVLVGVPGNHGAIIRHRFNTFDAIWNDTSFAWLPTTTRDREEKFTTTAAHGEEEMSFGVLQVYSQNTLSSGASIGSILLDLDVTFTNPW